MSGGINREALFPCAGVHCSQRTAGGDAGIGHQDVETAVSEPDLIERPAHLPLIGHIQGHADRSFRSCISGNLGGDGFRPPAVDVGDDHMRSLSRKAARNRATNAAGSAGYQSDLAGEQSLWRLEGQLVELQQPVFSCSNASRSESDA